MKSRVICLSVLILLGFPLSALADELSYKITIKDHKFSPEVLRVPAKTKVEILVENLDPAAEEFESYDMNREKVVAANGKITLFIGPLKTGVYKYFGDFHPQSAEGRIVVKENG